MFFVFWLPSGLESLSRDESVYKSKLVQQIGQVCIILSDDEGTLSCFKLS